ncbi:hypothetical protein C8Q76DRAFT_744017 [Earliella scabrosa]|nr:hypothetical protein C8Q76DRAFT_744017 [Earliella scabrosa]
MGQSHSTSSGRYVTTRLSCGGHHGRTTLGFLDWHDCNELSSPTETHESGNATVPETGNFGTRSNTRNTTSVRPSPTVTTQSATAFFSSAVAPYTDHTTGVIFTLSRVKADQPESLYHSPTASTPDPSTMLTTTDNFAQFVTTTLIVAQDSTVMNQETPRPPDAPEQGAGKLKASIAGVAVAIATLLLLILAGALFVRKRRLRTVSHWQRTYGASPAETLPPYSLRSNDALKQRPVLRSMSEKPELPGYGYTAREPQVDDEYDEDSNGLSQDDRRSLAGDRISSAGDHQTRQRALVPLRRSPE